MRTRFFKKLVFEKGVVSIHNGSRLELKSSLQLGDDCDENIINKHDTIFYRNV